MLEHRKECMIYALVLGLLMPPKVSFIREHFASRTIASVLHMSTHQDRTTRYGNESSMFAWALSSNVLPRCCMGKVHTKLRLATPGRAVRPPCLLLSSRHASSENYDHFTDLRIVLGGRFSYCADIISATNTQTVGALHLKAEQTTLRTSWTVKFSHMFCLYFRDVGVEAHPAHSNTLGNKMHGPVHWANISCRGAQARVLRPWPVHFLVPPTRLNAPPFGFSAVYPLFPALLRLPPPQPHGQKHPQIQVEGADSLLSLRHCGLPSLFQEEWGKLPWAISGWL